MKDSAEEFQKLIIENTNQKFEELRKEGESKVLELEDSFDKLFNFVEKVSLEVMINRQTRICTFFKILY